MSIGIRAATPDDAAGVAAFFSAVYEGEHGLGSAGALEMLQRTVAVLFPDHAEPPAVYVYESGAAIQGVGAVRPGNAEGACELITIQVFDNVQGRGIAQRLLHRVVELCSQQGATKLYTMVPLADVRARGFLRREGFVADAEDGIAAGGPPDSIVRYVLGIGAP